MVSTSWSDAGAMMSIEVNGTFIPFASTPDSMQRFVRPALFSTGYDDWELNTFGTAVMCRYRGLSLGLTTQHQVSGKGKPSAEKFVVLAHADDRTLAIPPTNLTRLQIEQEEYKNLQDLCIFEFGDRFSNNGINALRIYDILWSDADLKYMYSFLIGYPTESSDMSIDSEGKLTSFANKWIRQDLRPDESRSMDPENRTMFVHDERSTRRSVEPDGLSGSPVFSIVQDEGMKHFLRFDGIVTDARPDRFAVYPSIHIRDALDKIVADR